jgi:hypothetical protein
MNWMLFVVFLLKTLCVLSASVVKFPTYFPVELIALFYLLQASKLWRVRLRVHESRGISGVVSRRPTLPIVPIVPIFGVYFTKHPAALPRAD